MSGADMYKHDQSNSVLPQDPVFVVIRTKGVLKPITYRQLQTKNRLLIGKTGRDPTLFALIVSGGAVVHGRSRLEFQHHGDWLSHCCKKYWTFDFLEKLSVSETMSIKIINMVENWIVCKEIRTVGIKSYIYVFYCFRVKWRLSM